MLRQAPPFDECVLTTNVFERMDDGRCCPKPCEYVCPPGLDDALEYILSIQGSLYGWWTGGAIPAGAPA